MGIWLLGKQVAKRKAKKRAPHYGDAVHAARSGVTNCGRTPPGALDWSNNPSAWSRFPAFLAGAVVGFGAMASRPATAPPESARQTSTARSRPNLARHSRRVGPGRR